jgi:hypothetical protein
MVGATCNNLFIAAAIMAAVTTTGWADSQDWSAPNGAHPSQYLAGLWDACSQRDAALVAVNSTDVSPGPPAQLEEGQAIIEYEWVSDLWDTVLALIPYYLNHTAEATWDDSSAIAAAWSQATINASADITAPDKPAVNNWAADTEWMTYLYEVLNRLLWIRNDTDPWTTSGTEKLGYGNPQPTSVPLYCPVWTHAKADADTAWAADTAASPPSEVPTSWTPKLSIYGPGSYTWGGVTPYGNPLPCSEVRRWAAKKVNRVGKLTPPTSYAGFDISSNYYLKAEAPIGTTFYPRFDAGSNLYGLEDDVYDKLDEEFTTAGNYYLFAEAPSSEVTVGDNDEPTWCNEPPAYDAPWPETVTDLDYTFSSRGWIATDTYAVIKFDGDDGFTHTA